MEVGLQTNLAELGDSRHVPRSAKRSEKCHYFLRDLPRVTYKNKINEPVYFIQRPSCSSNKPTAYELPVEILTMIFSHLTATDRVSVMRVCKQWCDIVKSPVLWQHIELKSNSVMKINGLAVLKMSPLLKTANIRNRKDFEQLLYQICKTNHRIEDLALKRCPCPVHYPYLQPGMRKCKCCNEHQCRLGDLMTCRSGFIRSHVALGMLKHCRQLKSLQLVNVNIQSNKFFKELGVAMKHLTKLTIAYCISFTEKHLHAIVETCNNIEQFTLLGNDFEGFKWETSYQLLLEKWGRTLTHLELNIGQISHVVLEGLVNCENLKKLWLDFCFQLDYGGIEAIAKLRHLEDLHISHCRNMNATTILALVEPNNLKKLKILSLKNSTLLDDDCLALIAKQFPLLEKIDLTRCIGISDIGLLILLRGCRHLNELNLYKAGEVYGHCFSDFTSNSQLKVIIDKYGNEEREHQMIQSSAKNLTIKLQWV